MGIKKGDWVILKDNSLIKLKSLDKLILVKEKWIPKVGDICWFWSKGDTHRVLAKYHSEGNQKYYTIDLLDEIDFDYCEPYIINQLPYQF